MDPFLVPDVGFQWWDVWSQFFDYFQAYLVAVFPMWMAVSVIGRAVNWMTGKTREA